MKLLFLVHQLGIEGDPLGLMQLVSIARNAGWELKLCTCLDDDIIDVCSQFQPDLISISMMSADFPPIVEKSRKIRQEFADLPILVGGPHPTFCPECVSEPSFSGICVGEGDGAFLDVLHRIEQGIAWDDVPNIHTRHRKNPVRPLVENLDELPFMDRELIYQKSPAMRRFRLRSFAASRGCPYQCTYCFNHAYHRLYRGLGKIVRRRSVDHLLAEVKEVVAKYPTSYIRFADDAFAHRVDDWLQEFSRRYRQEVGIPFYCLIRADCVDEQMVQLLKETGCRSVCMSIESANEEIRKTVLNRNVTNEQLIRAFDLFNEAGIHIYTNNMVALPGSTLQDEWRTIELNIRCRPAVANFSVCTPYPGTTLYDYCRTNDLVSESVATITTQHESILNSFSAKEKSHQINVALLGPTVIHWPWLKPLVFHVLMHLPPNLLYRLIHFIVKNMRFSRYIVPIRYTLSEYISLGWQQLSWHFRQWKKTESDSV